MSKQLRKNLRWKERGNVLFLILIAVALFAALSYAVTSSSRSGGGDAGGETSLISSAQITQYPASIRTAIIRMLVRGIQGNQLLFTAPANFSADLTNETLRNQAVFHPDGGAATLVTAPPEVMEDGEQGTWFFNSLYEIENVGRSEIGAATSNLGNDIIAFLPGIQNTVCIRLNDQLGIEAVPGAGNNDEDSDGVPGGPTVVPSTNMEVGAAGIGVAAPAANEIDGVFAGQAYGCYDADDASADDDEGDYVYYHVLVER